MPEVCQNRIAKNAGLQQNGLRANPGEGIRGKRRVPGWHNTSISEAEFDLGKGGFGIPMQFIFPTAAAGRNQSWEAGAPSGDDS
jgi:hypothetical protein